MPGPLTASYYPRVVIPHVGINVEIHTGDGGTPRTTSGWRGYTPAFRTLARPTNSYLYAHAHGQPQGSASGLFWPLHYMHPWDAVYVYPSATDVIRYQAVTVDRQHSGSDDSPLRQTTDEWVTLQTCNDWAPSGPKTIVVAERYVDPPPPAPPVSVAQQHRPGTGGGGPTPQPQPSPNPKPWPIPLSSPPHTP